MEAKIVPSSQNGMVELTVRDFGCGIPKRQIVTNEQLGGFVGKIVNLSI